MVAEATEPCLSGLGDMKDWLIAFVAAASLVGLTIWTARVVMLMLGV